MLSNRCSNKKLRVYTVSDVNWLINIIVLITSYSRHREIEQLRMCTHNKDKEWYIYLYNKGTMSQSLPQTCWNYPRMCTHNKDNEWYMYIYLRLRNYKDTVTKLASNLVEWPTSILWA